MREEPAKAEILLTELENCFASQNRFGRQASEFESWSKAIINDVCEYEAEALIKAVAKWRRIQNSIPAASDIIRIAEGKPILSREIYQRAKKLADDTEEKYISNYSPAKEKAKKYCEYYEAELLGYALK